MQEPRYLSPVEARVLGTIIEKEYISPMKYPITLNVLTAGCKQVTNRHPIMRWVLKSDILAALELFKSIDLVTETQGKTVPHYSHNLQRVLKINGQAICLFCVLLLRGPQTASQLRVNVASLHHFSTVDDIEYVLMELHKQGESIGKPLVSKMPRVEGDREGRWSELLTRPLRGHTPKLTREELTHEVNLLRTRLEFIEQQLCINQELNAPYDDTVTSRFDA